MAAIGGAAFDVRHFGGRGSLAVSTILMIVGALGIAISALPTRAYWNRAGLRSHEARSASAGRRIVLSYVSFLNLASWACLLFGGVLVLLEV